MTVPADARCAVHPDQPAVDTCARCGNFVCLRCLAPLDAQVFCDRCVALALEAKRMPVSQLPTVGITLGLLGLATSCVVIGAPIAIAGATLGVISLRRMAARQISSVNRLSAWVSIGFAVFAAAIAAYVWLGRMTAN